MINMHGKLCRYPLLLQTLAMSIIAVTIFNVIFYPFSILNSVILFCMFFVGDYIILDTMDSVKKTTSKVKGKGSK